MSGIKHGTNGNVIFRLKIKIVKNNDKKKLIDKIANKSFDFFLNNNNKEGILYKFKNNKILNDNETNLDDRNIINLEEKKERDNVLAEEEDDEGSNQHQPIVTGDADKMRQKINEMEATLKQMGLTKYCKDGPTIFCASSIDIEEFQTKLKKRKDNWEGENQSDIINLLLEMEKNNYNLTFKGYETRYIPKTIDAIHRGVKLGPGSQENKIFNFELNLADKKIKSKIEIPEIIDKNNKENKSNLVFKGNKYWDNVDLLKRKEVLKNEYASDPVLQYNEIEKIVQIVEDMEKKVNDQVEKLEKTKVQL